MTKPGVKIVNAETGEIIEREMNDAELLSYEKLNKDIADRKAAQEAAKAEAAAKRQALLDKLGITEDEARLLLGGN